MTAHQSALTSILDLFLLSEIVTMQWIDGIAYKLKPRLFHNSTHLQAHLADFHSQCGPHLTIVRDRIKQFSFLIDHSMKWPNTLIWTFSEFNLIVKVESKELSKFTEDRCNVYLKWVWWGVKDSFSWINQISDNNDFWSFLRVNGLIYTTCDGEEFSFHTGDIYYMM